MNVFSFQATDSMKELLYRDPAQAIAHLSLKAGQEVPEHSGADAIVTVVPVIGEIIFSTHEQVETLVPGKIVRLNASERHALKAIKNSEIIVVKWQNA